MNKDKAKIAGSQWGGGQGWIKGKVAGLGVALAVNGTGRPATASLAVAGKERRESNRQNAKDSK